MLKVRQEVPDDPGEDVLQETDNVCREVNRGQLTKYPTMKLLTWSTYRLPAGGRELALVNLLEATGADIATIT
jgi:hypothetical protein